MVRLINRQTEDVIFKPLKLILGHDHDYNIKNIHNKFILKSGTDFREFSLIELIFNKKSKSSFVNKIERIIVDSTVAENEKIKNIVDNYMGMFMFMRVCVCCVGFNNYEIQFMFVYLRSASKAVRSHAW